MFTIRRNVLAAATLALGVAACTAIFSFIRPLLLDPLTYPHASELVTIEPRDAKGNIIPATLANYQAWAQEKSAFRDVAAFDIGFFFLTDAALVAMAAASILLLLIAFAYGLPVLPVVDGDCGVWPAGCEKPVPCPVPVCPEVRPFCPGCKGFRLVLGPFC